MGRGGSRRALSVNTWLIIINCAVFVIQAFLKRSVVTFPSGFTRIMDPFEYYGHFSTGMGFLPNMEVWRLVTFQFLHAGPLHLFLNMFGLWVFGGLVEDYLGAKRYAAFYLVCGICGGLMYLLLNLLGHFGVPVPGALVNDIWIPLVGASAGVFGVIVASAYIAPNEVIQLLFPPIPLRLKFFAYGYVAIAMLNLILGGRNAGGDAAHVGGAIAGFFFIRNAHLLHDFFDILGDSRKAPRARRRAKVGDQDEIDRILAKIRQHGLASLTDRERRTLKRDAEAQERVR